MKPFMLQQLGFLYGENTTNLHQLCRFMVGLNLFHRIFFPLLATQHQQQVADLRKPSVDNAQHQMTDISH